MYTLAIRQANLKTDLLYLLYKDIVIVDIWTNNVQIFKLI